MLQQNSYFPKRYYGWVKNNFSVTLALLAISYCIASLLFAKVRYIALLVFSAVILITRIVLAIRTQKKSIKKLVFTSRIKRLFGAAIILSGVLIALYEIVPENLIGQIGFVLSLMFSIVTPLLTLVVWCLTYPIEKAFTNYYINDAKKILKSMPDLKVIGITGSYGKTSTKFILNRILSEHFNTVCTPQSFNTPMGVVRTIREKLTAPTQVFICEMGAKKVHDIKEICDIVSPEYGIITSVGPQHLDTFKSIENVYKTKFELADAVADKSKTFINLDSAEISSRAEKGFNTCGTTDSADYYAQNIVYSSGGATFDIVLKGERITVATKLLGKHNVLNITTAAAVAYTMGVTADEIKYAVGTLKPTEHRLELKNHLNGSIVIDDAYNANPEGCLSAVDVLANFKNKKKIIITPGLIELGEKEYECNYNLGAAAAEKCDIIVFVGKHHSEPMQKAVLDSNFNKDNMFIVNSFSEAMQTIAPMQDENTVILWENDLPDNYLN